jgi:hypothetical protein
MPRKSLSKIPADGSLPTVPHVSTLIREDADAAKALSAEIARMRDDGASGQDIRDRFGEGLTGGMRRKLFRAFGDDSGRIARSYDVHRDGQPRTGTPRIAVEGSKAQTAFLAAKAEEEAAAKAASKRKRAASKAAATRKARKSA